MRQVAGTIANSAVATGKGDDGTTGLLYGGRVAKDDLGPRPTARSTRPSPRSALRARGADASAGLRPELTELACFLRCQRELFVVGAELAANPDALRRLEDGSTRVSEAMLEGVEVGAGTLGGGRRDAARVHRAGRDAGIRRARGGAHVLRRAERRAITAGRELSHRAAPWMVPYLNRPGRPAVGPRPRRGAGRAAAATPARMREA